MTNINITFPDPNTYTSLVTAVCANGNYQANIPDPDNPGQTMPNPTTQDQFLQTYIATTMANIIIGYQTRMANLSAQKTAQTTYANAFNVKTS